MRSECKSRRDGYVLLMVLAVVVLLTTVLASLAKTSLRRALAAADAQRRLQQRWGSESLQRAVLPRAVKVFEEADLRAQKLDPETPPSLTLRDALTMGGVTFDLILGDEDAKLNLNAVYRLSGERGTLSALGRILPNGVTSLVRLSPAPEPDHRKTRSNADDESDLDADELPPPDVFRSWGEVFDVSRISATFGNDAALPNLTTAITCWGSGQSNIRRASDEIIQATLSSVLSETQASRVVGRYRENPAMSPQILLQNQVEDETQRTQLSRMFSQTSSNHSLWIDASSTGRRSLRRFTVMQRDESGMTRFYQFAH